MSKNIISKLFLIFSVLILTSYEKAHATSITVKKVKGNQAVIEMSSPLEAGQTYNLENEAVTLHTDYSAEFKSRYNSITLGASVALISGNKTLENDVRFIGRYGWNHSRFEFGPTLDFEVYDNGFGTGTNYLIGGYYDYNYVENRSPREMVYGPTVQFALGNRNYASGGSSQITQLQVGGFFTWFINGSPVALKTELGYLYRKVTSSAAESALTGFNSQIYLIYYY